MKKRILVFAAMFLVMLGIAFAPAKTTQAKSNKYTQLNGKYFSVPDNTRLKVTKGKIRINGYLWGYGKNKDFGRVKKTFKTAKNVKFVQGMEVNELITDHKISRKEFVKRYKAKDFGSIVTTFKKGKITRIKIVYD